MVECCIHGRACSIAKKLSSKGNSEDEDDIDEKRQSEQPHRESPPYYGLMPKNISSERNSTSNAISYGLKRKVERQSLDVPLGEWNQEGSLRSKSDSLNYLGQSPSARYETKVTRNNDENSRHQMRSSKEKRHIERVALMAEGGVEKLSKKDLNNSDNDQNLNISSPNTYDTFNCFDSQDGVIHTANVQSDNEQLATIRAAYIGPLRKHEAEEFISKPTSFKIYHRMPNSNSLSSITSHLPLFIAYRSGRGRIHHYAINESKVYERKGAELTPVTSYQVDYGDPSAPRFFTIESLIHYYTVYVHLRRTKHGECVADIFPRLRPFKRNYHKHSAHVN